MIENEKLKNYGFVSDNYLVEMSKNKKDVSFDISSVALKLQLKDIGRNKLYAILKKKGFIDQYNCALPEYVRKGFFINEMAFVNGKVFHKTKVTLKGLNYLKIILKE